MTSDRARLIEEQIPSLRRYARALVGARGDADDLVHDCVERALSRWHLWRSDRDLRPWLFTIMHNQFISQRRKAARRPAPAALQEDADYTATPPTQGGGLLLQELAGALAELADDQRAVVLLIGLEGFSYDEAAGILGVPRGTVTSRLARGRERLRRLMAGEEGPVLRRVK